MAAIEQRSGPNGFGLTISTDAVYPSSLDDVKIKIKKNKRIWKKLREELTADPQNFEKPQRFINDRMPIPGPAGKGKTPAAAWFGGGYEGRFKLREADKRVKITSNRPYVPQLSNAFIDNILVPELLDYWLEADVPSGSIDHMLG